MLAVSGAAVCLGLKLGGILQMKARHGHMKRVEVEGGRLLQMALSSMLTVSMSSNL